MRALSWSKLVHSLCVCAVMEVLEAGGGKDASGGQLLMPVQGPPLLLYYNSTMRKHFKFSEQEAETQSRSRMAKAV